MGLRAVGLACAASGAADQTQLSTPEPVEAGIRLYHHQSTTARASSLTSWPSAATEARSPLSSPAAAARRPPGGAALVAAAIASAEGAGAAIAAGGAEDERALGLHLQPRPLNLHAFAQQRLQQPGGSKARPHPRHTSTAIPHDASPACGSLGHAPAAWDDAKSAAGHGNNHRTGQSLWAGPGSLSATLAGGSPARARCRQSQ